MKSLVRGFLSQSAKMDPTERLRKVLRGIDSYPRFRKVVFVGICVFALVLYVGPYLFSWLFTPSKGGFLDPPESCASQDPNNVYADELKALDAHAVYEPPRPHRAFGEDVPYVGNGNFALVVDYEAFLYVKISGRSMGSQVPFRPVVKVSPNWGLGGFVQSSKTTVTSYVRGLVHSLECHSNVRLGVPLFSISSKTYAHRAVPEVLVQEIKVTNPSAENMVFRLDRGGISMWERATVSKGRIDDRKRSSNQKYLFVSGNVTSAGGGGPVSPPWPLSNGRNFSLILIAAPELEDVLTVQAGRTETLTVLSALVMSDLATAGTSSPDVNILREKAVEAIRKAKDIADLESAHTGVWKELWRTGLGISHSMADDSINGRRINATMYYILSQSPAPLHDLSLAQEEKTKFYKYLSATEGCYGNLPTLHESKNLWRQMMNVEQINSVVQYWFLNLDVNGCHGLVKAGADGVVQALALSLLGFKFRQTHLELDANPKDLHRDFYVRRIRYGDGTHVNVSIVVQEDNKPIIEVKVDRNDKDYFACDAGCLDPPVRLSATHVVRFPVKLTSPVTAVLYITSDYAHMQQLKHTIHVKEVADAPPHEHEVMALHKHGTRIGLPAVFWFSIGFLVLVFHIFLFKLIWQEYCAGGQERYRSSKFI